MWFPLACTSLRHPFIRSRALENCLKALHVGISQMKQLLPQRQGTDPWGKSFFSHKHERGGERAGKPSGHPDFCVCWSRSLPITITLSCIPNLLQLPWGAGRICIQPGLQRLCFRKSWQVSHSRATTALPSL